jgi:2'-5' RNA ligase
MRLSRLFTAVELPEAVKTNLLALKTKNLGLKWATPKNLHLTLRFIDETPTETVPAIKKALRTVRVSPFTLVLNSLGLFERPRQIILWAGLVDFPELLSLKGSIDSALSASLSLTSERERFSPHITLGRLKNSDSKALHDFVGTHSPEITRKFSVTSVTLFTSTLTSKGAIHSPKETYFL